MGRRPRGRRIVAGLVAASTWLATAACGGPGPTVPKASAPIVRDETTEPAPGTTSTSSAPTPSTPACDTEHGSLSTHELHTASGVDRVAVYLPPCAVDGSGRRYPTVYLLHGAGADETQWPAIGLASTADALIAAHEIAPVIVVMPSSGLDASDSTIVDDVVPWADANLPTSPSRAARAIGGISAGGAASIRLVTLHPSLFSRLGGHSPVVDASPSALDQLSAWDGSVWLDVGQSDDLRQSTENLMARLKLGTVPAQLNVWPGGHDRAYWGAHVADYLRFYAGR